MVRLSMSGLIGKLILGYLQVLVVPRRRKVTQALSGLEVVSVFLFGDFIVEA